MSTTRIALRLTTDELDRATELARTIGIDRTTLIRLGLRRALAKPPNGKEIDGASLPIGLAAAEPGQAARNAGNRRDSEVKK